MTIRGTAETYRVFVRNWWRWKSAPDRWYRGGGKHLVPDPGARKITLATHCTEEEARAHCAEYRRTHEPGPLSRKAEYERE